MQEFIGEGFPVCDRLGGDDMFEWPPLVPGEDGQVDQGRHGSQLAAFQPDIEWIFKVLAHEYHPPPRAPQRLVGRGGYEVAMRHGVGKQPFGDEPGRVSDIREQQGPYLVCNFTESRKIHIPGIGRGAGDDHTRFFTLRYFQYGVIIEPAGFPVHPVKHRAVQFSREIYR